MLLRSPTIRRMGYEAIAEKAINDGIVDEIVPRLIDMLTIEEMGERRSAVQALGIIGGDRVLKPIADLLLSTDDTTVRASCSKCLGAVALKNPETIPDFPQSALDGMKKAVAPPPPLPSLTVTFLIDQTRPTDP
jgi:HEAT repeat protein